MIIIVKVRDPAQSERVAGKLRMAGAEIRNVLSNIGVVTAEADQFALEEARDMPEVEDAVEDRQFALTRGIDEHA